jgi:hypothetical protein
MPLHATLLVPAPTTQISTILQLLVGLRSGMHRPCLRTSIAISHWDHQISIHWLIWNKRWTVFFFQNKGRRLQIKPCHFHAVYTRGKMARLEHNQIKINVLIQFHSLGYQCKHTLWCFSHRGKHRQAFDAEAFAYACRESNLIGCVKIPLKQPTEWSVYTQWTKGSEGVTTPGGKQFSFSALTNINFSQSQLQ